MTTIELLTTTPRPALIVTCPASADARKDAAQLVFDRLLEMGIFPVLCRGVELDRLPVILSNGCDVVPTNSPIFADFMDKAIEYGGAAQVVQVFDTERLKRTFVEIDANADASTIKKLKDAYRSWQLSAGGNKIWFSMLSLEDRRCATGYEAAYGWFIPDNPWDALIALAVFVEADRDRETALSLLDKWADQA